ncbi:dimeric alpha-beta barrel [Pyrenophora seminiperda CCB06]|uniref:Dimeric alpha-beta barrel n=1 Tax=Pyrenophora seminiperda CCB06 TaxID=1302712 RepID=A0A3M7M3V8_9PLEO|nr:dimeric alpha-beta barrel [Pyrenophora seminiperda CCB06]
MPVTEIALLHLSPGTSIHDQDFRGKLAYAKTVIQKATSRNVYYLQQVEDPACVYIIAEWKSLSYHMEDFIPSSANQSLLQSLDGMLTVEWLQHIDALHADLPLPETEAQMEAACRGQPVWSIVRHMVKAEEKQRFQGAFDANKGYLQEFITEGKIGGGWRVDGEEAKDEFVLLSPWKSVEQHMEFGKTDGFKKYAGLREFIDEADIKHATLLGI